MLNGDDHKILRKTAYEHLVAAVGKMLDEGEKAGRRADSGFANISSTIGCVTSSSMSIMRRPARVPIVGGFPFLVLYSVRSNRRANPEPPHTERRGQGLPYGAHRF